MFNILDIDKDIIENAFNNNELDKLIHDTYNKHGRTKYYQMFCDQNINIGRTCLI